MRSCDEIVELISASLDGELSADEQTALDEHIARCPACSALLDDLRALHMAAADWEEVSAPAGFAEAVMSAIAAEAEPEKPDNVIPFAAPRKAKRNYWKKWGLSAAAVAIVVLGAVSAPSLMGNFAPKKDAAMEMAYARDDADAVMDMLQTECCEDSKTSVQAERDVNYEEPPAELVPGEDYEYSVTTKPHEPLTNIPVPSAAPEEEPYVGELILDGMLETLSGQEGAASSDGTVTYLVSADVFAEVLQVLELEKPVGYVYTAGNPNASRGKIIVQSTN